MSVSDSAVAAYLITAESILSLSHDGEDKTYPLYAGTSALTDTASGPLCFTPDRAYRFAFVKDEVTEAVTDETQDETSDSEAVTDDTGADPTL